MSRLRAWWTGPSSSWFLIGQLSVWAVVQLGDGGWGWFAFDVALIAGLWLLVPSAARARGIDPNNGNAA